MGALKKVLSSKIFLFCALLAVIWMGLVSVKAYYRKNQLDQEIASLKNDIGKLDKSDQNLSQLIKYFNNQNYLAQVAKDKLNLKAQGESVVMVPEGALGQQLASENATSTVSVQPQASSAADNNLVKWWKYLFGR